MKRIIIAILCLLCVGYSAAQQADFSIGELRLGADLDVLTKLGYSKKIERLTSISDFFEKAYKVHGRRIYEYEMGAFDYAPKVKEVRKFYVPQYKVDDKLTVKFIELSFLDERLYRVDCVFTPELSDWLSEKYGECEIRNNVEFWTEDGLEYSRGWSMYDWSNYVTSSSCFGNISTAMLIDRLHTHRFLIMYVNSDNARVRRLEVESEKGE